LSSRNAAASASVDFVRGVSCWELLWVVGSLGHVGLLLSGSVLAGVGVGVLIVLGGIDPTGRSLDCMRAVSLG